MRWQKMALIGVGLLGGSLGRAVRRRSLVPLTHAFVRREASVVECRSLEVADEISLDLQAVVRDADLVILCTPVAQMKAIVERFNDGLKPGCVVTDVGSTKAELARELAPIIEREGGVFIGSHPMAGSEKTGVAHSDPDLFEGAVCAVTPTGNEPAASVEALKKFWSGLGSEVLEISPEHHDELVARCSHVPHILATELSRFGLKECEGGDLVRRLGGSGFRDTTRLASGSPEMWRDICLSNREQLLKRLSEYEDGLREFRELLASGDADAVQRYFAEGKQLRDAWLQDRFSS